MSSVSPKLFAIDANRGCLNTNPLGGVRLKPVKSETYGLFERGTHQIRPDNCRSTRPACSDASAGTRPGSRRNPVIAFRSPCNGVMPIA